MFAKHGVDLSAISAFTGVDLGEMLPWLGEIHVETDKFSDDKEWVGFVYLAQKDDRGDAALYGLQNPRRVR